MMSKIKDKVTRDAKTIGEFLLSYSFDKASSFKMILNGIRYPAS